MTTSISCEEGYVNAGKGQVFYRTYSSTGGVGTPLVVIHGGPGFTQHYLAPLHTLARERPVVLYDQLGCGGSERPELESFCQVDYFTDELAALVDQLGYETVALLGHSWGSTVAANYAINSAIGNEQVSHVVFASPYLSTDLWNEDIDRYVSAMPERLRAGIRCPEDDPVYKEAYSYYYGKYVYGAAAHDRSIALSTEESSAAVYRYMWGQNEFAVTGLLKDQRESPDLSKITARVLFTCGEFDTGSPRACRELAKRLPGAEIFTISGGAHFPHLENRELYNRVVRSFLNDQPLPEQPGSNKMSFVKKLGSLFR